MDSLDDAIIEILREDGRIANVALAERVGLTPGACLRRVQRLEADGVIVGYAAQIASEAMGQSFEVLLDIELTHFDKGSVETFEDTLAQHNEVLELHRLFGTPDYLARIGVANLPAYEAFLTDKVLVIPGINRVSSRFPMKTIKSLRPIDHG